MADISSVDSGIISLKRQREDSSEDQMEISSQGTSLDGTNNENTTKKLKTVENDGDLTGNPKRQDGVSPSDTHAFDSGNEKSENVKNIQKEAATGNIDEYKTTTTDKADKVPEEPEVIELNSDSEDDGPSTSGLGPDGVMMINDDEDEGDIDDNISDISGVSDVSLEEMRWTSTTITGPVAWIQRQMANEVDPRTVLKELVSSDTVIPDNLEDITLWKAVLSMLMDPPKRKKLPSVNTLEDAIGLIETSSKIMVLTGAGVSVSCGIPDFRSKDGIYAKLAVDYPDLPDPQAMFDIHYFTKNQKPFFKFAKEIYPGQFQPSTSHKFIKLIEDHHSLLRNYTQNIDTLEQVAGIERAIQCHGSFVNATCMICRYKVDHKAVEEDIMNQVIPRCPNCPDTEPLAIMKPDIVFFGESLPGHFHRQMEKDKKECDLLIVMGSSLKVKPVALIPNALPPHIPQILINREPIKHQNFDIELLGNCDDIVQELCHRLGGSWSSICQTEGPSYQISRDELKSAPIVTGPEVPSGSSIINKEESGNSESTEAVSSTGDDKNNAGEEKSSEKTVDVVAHSSENDSSTSGVSTQDKSGNNASPSNKEETRKDGAKVVEMESINTDSNNQEKEKVAPPMEGDLKTNPGDSNPEKVEVSKSPGNIEEVSNPGKIEEVSKQVKVSENGDGDAVAQGVKDSNMETNDSSKENKDDVMVIESESTSGKAGTSEEVKEGESQDDSAPKLTEKELEEMRACWKPRFVNLATQLKDNTFLFIPPHRYIFKGADFLQDLDEVSEYSSASHISIGDSSDEDDNAPKTGNALPSITKENQKKNSHILDCELLENVTSGIESTAESDDVTMTGNTTETAKDSETKDVITSVTGLIDSDNQVNLGSEVKTLNEANNDTMSKSIDNVATTTTGSNKEVDSKIINGEVEKVVASSTTSGIDNPDVKLLE